LLGNHRIKAVAIVTGIDPLSQVQPVTSPLLAAAKRDDKGNDIKTTY
jgi:hypothetical protein